MYQTAPHVSLRLLNLLGVGVVLAMGGLLGSLETSCLLTYPPAPVFPFPCHAEWGFIGLTSPPTRRDSSERRPQTNPR